MCKLVDLKNVSPVALRDLNRKMMLEVRLRRELRPVFNQIVRDFRDAYRVSGLSINVAYYKPQFETLLLNHYKRVQNEFRGTVERDNGSKFLVRYEMKQEEDDNIEELILLALLLWRSNTAPIKAEFITQTNDIQIQRAIEAARQDLIDNNEPVTNATVAAGATVILKRLYDNRVERIIITETQAAAEGTNAIEAAVFAGTVPVVASQLPGVTPATEQRTVLKTWRDMDDARVRPSHSIAGDTMINIPQDQPFIVGGQRLMFPGDISLGATAREIANCRCYTEYTFR